MRSLNKTMNKVDWKPGTMINPVPAVLVSCGNATESNFLTIAWTGTICTNPPMCYISVRPERYSYDMICRHMEFTINLTTADMAKAVDWAGVRSGRDYDKWKETRLTPLPGVAVSCPSIAESPLNIECRVKQIMELGSHYMFMAEVVNVRADESLINPETGKFDLENRSLLAYSHGVYHALGESLGTFGWSVKKKKQ